MTTPTLPRSALGGTNLQVTRLGLGTSELGLTETSDSEAERMLCGALDAGLNVLDTAAAYGDAEELIGRYLAARRDEFVLVTKCGHFANRDNPAAWTATTVRDSLQQSLQRMKTDRVDVLLLHSCTADQFDNEELIDALLDVKRKGLARYVGYSGDNEDATAAVNHGSFDVLETSVNLADQQVIDQALRAARQKQVGVIAKRPLANCAWQTGSNTRGIYAEYVRPYARRIARMKLIPETVGFDGSMLALALRFTAYQPGVGVMIAGGKNLDHLHENLALLAEGPLPDDVVERLRACWRESDDGTWRGQL